VIQKSTARKSIEEALALFGYSLEEASEYEKCMRGLQDRKGKVYQVRGADDKILCTYASLSQIKQFVSRKIGG
jgi:hypothetical protein